MADCFKRDTNLPSLQLMVGKLKTLKTLWLNRKTLKYLPLWSKILTDHQILPKIDDQVINENQMIIDVNQMTNQFFRSLKKQNLTIPLKEMMKILIFKKLTLTFY